MRSRSRSSSETRGSSGSGYSAPLIAMDIGASIRIGLHDEADGALEIIRISYYSSFVTSDLFGKSNELALFRRVERNQHHTARIAVSRDGIFDDLMPLIS